MTYTLSQLPNKHSSEALQNAEVQIGETMYPTAIVKDLSAIAPTTCHQSDNFG